MKQIPFYRPLIKEYHLEEIKDSFAAPHKNKIEGLEAIFKQYVCTEHAISVVNNSLAMHLAMCAIDLKRGDKVICPINSHPFITESIRQFDAEPIFCDINFDNYIIDADKLDAICAKNSSKKLKAVVVSHFAGEPANISVLREIADRYNIRVIEDATYSLGSEFNGRKIGCCSLDIAIFSLEPDMENSISNCAFLTTNHDVLDERARLMRYHAMKPQESGMQLYDIVDIGCKLDISGLDTAYSLANVKKIGEKIARQDKIAQIYQNELGTLERISLPSHTKGRTFWLYIIKVEKNRDAFAKEMREEGVECGIHFIPLNLTSYYKNKYSLKVNEFPNALKAFQQALSLPLFADMSDDEAHYVCEKIKKIAKNWI